MCLSQFKNKQTENFPERKISIIFCTDFFLFEEKIKGKEQMTKKKIRGRRNDVQMKREKKKKVKDFLILYMIGKKKNK